MQSIKIFVASSIVAFGAERRSIAALFCELNNRLINEGVFYNVHFCEELDNAVSESRKQNEYNAYIANSNMVFFLVDSDCGDYTFEEFDIALNSANNPRIIVFARYSEKTFGEHVKYMKQKSEEGRAEFIYFRDFSCVETRINEIVAEQTAELKIANLYAQPGYLKKVSFFLGTAHDENQQEKNGILRFTLSLNEKLLSEGIYAQIVPCIELSDDINSENMIARHKELIDNSEVAFFVFFEKVDDLSHRDLLYALEVFKNSKFPKIYTYFLEKEDDDESVSALKMYIDQNIHHYFSLFTNIDSIKLSILLHISSKYLSSNSLTVDNNMIMMRKMELLDVHELRAFSNNDTILQLRIRLDALQKEIEIVEEEFVTHRDRKELIKRLSDLGDEITDTQEKIHHEEQETLAMLSRMQENIIKGEVNELIKKAYRFLEKGMVDKANEILNKKTADLYYGDRISSQMDLLKNKVNDAINLYRHTIYIQKMLDESEQTIDTIISCYETIRGYAPLADVDIYAEVLMEYAQFLDQQNILTAERIFKETEYAFENPAKTKDLEQTAGLYSAIGFFYIKQFNAELSEKYLKKAYETFRNLYESDKKRYVWRFAWACKDYVRLDGKRKKTVLNSGLKAINDAIKEYDSSDWDAHFEEVAHYYYEAGSSYGGMGDAGREEALYREAAKILEERDMKSHLLADIYNNLAECIRENDKAHSHERTVGTLYDKAIRILQDIYATEPATCAGALGDLYNNKAIYYNYYGENYYQALQSLKSCEQIYLAWYQKNPRKYGQGLAECYIQMSYFYDSLGNHKRALLYVQKGIDLFEILAGFNYDRYAIKLAWAYSEKGMLCVLYELNETSRDCLFKSLEILEASENKYISEQETDVVLKVITVINYMIDKKNTDDENDVLYDLTDKVFRYSYKDFKKDINNKAEMVRLLYPLGEVLLYHFDQIDHENTRQFYYPAMTELGKLRLQDPTLTANERMMINFNIAAMLGLLGDMDHVDSYIQASLEAFEGSDASRGTESNRSGNGRKVTKKKNKRKRG